MDGDSSSIDRNHLYLVGIDFNKTIYLIISRRCDLEGMVIRIHGSMSHKVAAVEVFIDSIEYFLQDRN